jgi:hypothetical protein
MSETPPEWYREHALPPRDVRKKRDYLAYPFLSLYAYLKRVYLILGWQLFVFLIFSQLALKGILFMLTKRLLLPIFKNALGIQADAYAILETIAFLPWAVKPVVGLLSDVLVIGGYHKRFWLFQSFFVGVISSGLFFLSYVKGSAIGVALCVMGIQFQIAVYDLLSEGRYSVITREFSFTRSDIQTFTQALQAFGVLVAVTLVGLLSDYQLYLILLAVICALCVSPLWPTLGNYISEEKSTEKCVAYVAHAQANWRAVVLIVGVAISAPVTGALAQLGFRGISLGLAVLFVSVATCATFFTFPTSNRMIGRIALFQAITYLSRPSLGSAMDYFYTADATCLPNGPHFSMSYYIFITGVISTIAGIFSIVIYQRTLNNVKFRIVLIITSIIQGLAGLSDLILVWRLNVRMGIPDKWAYIIGEAIFEPVIQQLNYIPVTTLLSKVCIPGLESSIYALLAGLSNFCGGISELSGAFIYTWAGVNTATCDFTALGWLILGCHVLSPMIIGTAASILIPNVGQDESLIDERKHVEDFEQVPLDDVFPEEEGEQEDDDFT